MRRIILEFAAIVIAGFSMPAPCQDTGAADKVLAKGTSAGGLEIAVIEISEATRHDEAGQALVPLGSCPLGFAPAGMEGVMTVIPIPGKGAVIQLTITATAEYVATELSGPPVAIDDDGGRHGTHGPFSLPNLDVLKSLTSAGEVLHCEFPFDLDAERVRAIEFEGVRLDVAPQ